MSTSCTTNSKPRSYQSRNPRTTPLFNIVKDHLAAFKQVKPNLPGHVYQTLDALLTCGLPEWGFMRLKCRACTWENIVAYSCKKRGPCSSCGTKRMVEAAAHMTDHVLPEARYRQVVVTLPFPLRFWVATNRDLMSRVHGIVIKTLHRKLRSKGEEIGLKDPSVGSVTYIQRFGSAIQLTPHFHILAMEKAFTDTGQDRPRGHKLPELSDLDVQEILHDIIILVVALLKKRGFIDADEARSAEAPMDQLWLAHPEMQELLAESLKGPSSDLGNLIAPGFGYDKECAIKKSRLCYMQNGFSIHAARVIKPSDRRGLEKLISYMARPALSQDKLSYDGKMITYRLKSPWSDGRTELNFKPIAFLSRLAALIPPPKSHSARHSGVLAPAHKLRRLIILDPNKKKVFQPGGPRTEPKLVKNTQWAQCLARIFEVDVGKCLRCEADMAIVAFLFDGLEIARYLRHCGLLTTGPPSENPPPLILEPVHD